MSELNEAVTSDECDPSPDVVAPHCDRNNVTSPAAEPEVTSARVTAASSVSSVSEKQKSSLWRCSGLRWGYLVPRLFLAALFWCGLTFLLEPLGHVLLTSTAQTMLGTPVRMQQFSLRLVGMRTEMTGLQVRDRQNPARNALDIERVSVELNREAMLRQKLVIDRAVISGVKWNTEAELLPVQPTAEPTDSGWSQRWNDQASRWGNAAQLATSALLRQGTEAAGQLIDPRQLETVRLADEMEDAWKLRFEQFKQRNAVNEQKIKQLKQQLETARQANPLQQIELFAQLIREGERLAQEAEQLKQELSQWSVVANRDLQELDQARQRDLQRVEQLIAAVPINQEQLLLTLLGPTLSAQAAEWGAWLQWSGKFVSAMNTDFEPTRQLGRFHDFDQAGQLPWLLVKHCEISGLAMQHHQPIPFVGIIEHLTPTPAKYDQPCQFDFRLSHHGEYHVQGILDYRQPTPRYRIRCELETQEFPEQQLLAGAEGNLSLQTGQLHGQLDVLLQGDELKARIKWRQAGLVWNYQPATEPAEQNLLTGLRSPYALSSSADEDEFRPLQAAGKSALQQLNWVQLLHTELQPLEDWEGEIRVSGTVDDPRWSVQSETVDLLASRLKTRLQREWQRQQGAAEQWAQLTIQERMNQLTGQIDQEYRQLFQQLQGHQQLAQQLIEQTPVRSASGILDRILR